MATVNLGRIGFVPKGDWVAGEYKRLDIVRHNGAIWTPVIATTTDEPEQASTDWMLLVEDGEDGSAAFAALTGEPLDNEALKAILDSKLDVSSLHAGLTLYQTTADSDYGGGYKKLVTDIHDDSFDTTEQVIPLTITGEDQLLVSYITEVGEVIDHIDDVNLTTVGRIRAVQGRSSVYFKVFKVDALNSETLLATSNESTEIRIATFKEIHCTALLDHAELENTDRIAVKFYGNKTSAGAHSNIEIVVGGSRPMRTYFPIPVSAGGALGVTLDGPKDLHIGETATYQITNYNVFSEYAASITAGSAAVIDRTVVVTAPTEAVPVTLTVEVNGRRTNFDIDVQPTGIQTPVILYPADGAVNIPNSFLIRTDAFTPIGAADTQASATWELWSGANRTGNLLWTSLNNATDLQEIVLPASFLAVSQTFCLAVKKEGDTIGSSGWGVSNFTTAATFNGLIGVQGKIGFGAGVATIDMVSKGYTPSHDVATVGAPGYGVYTFSDGSSELCLPKFFYRIGHPESPRYDKYGENAVDVVGIETFPDEAAANAAGWAMPRCFVDGGIEHDFVMVDRFHASPNGTKNCKSVKGGIPLSLVATGNFTKTKDYGGEGNLADAIDFARGRSSYHSSAGDFIGFATAVISTAHGQAATSVVDCAWYDPEGVTNFPKGCNNGALGDFDDGDILYESAGDTGNLNKPKTGSANHFARTTHNGQENGIADLNGGMFEVGLGVTNIGANATDTASVSDGSAYVLKRSTKANDLTGGWKSGSGGNEAFGNAAHLEDHYDKINGFFPWGSATGAERWGNGDNRVLSGSVSGDGYLKTNCGVPDTMSSISAQGTNLFGKDECYKYNRANMMCRRGGYWASNASAGVWYRYWYLYRSVSYYNLGFRACAYVL